MFQATVSVLNVDVIGVTETWLTSDISDSEMQLAGYEMFRKDRDNARGGGVLLYVKHFLTPSEFYTSVTFHDQVWCKIDDLYIGVCYRSSNTAIVESDNNQNLLELITEVGNKHILLMGDFNVPNIDWVNHTPTPVADGYTKSFVKAVEESFLTQHVTVPTRENSVLDLIFSNEPDLVSNVDAIGNLDNSDHTMLLFKLHLEYESVDNRGVRRDYNRGDIAVYEMI